jgi:8-oxo-dGTP diphosphatase
MYVPHADPTQERYALVYGRYSGKWSFPKGHSQEGESPMECAQREIAEETGIEVLPESSKYIRLGFANYFLFPFPFYLPLVPKDMNEICDTRWATMDEMKHMPINVDVSRYRRLWMKQHEMTNEV